MRSFNIASGAAGRDVSSPRSHQMWWIPGPNRPRILQVNIFETSDLDLLDLCWMSPDPLRWQLWRSEWWCPETHVRLRGFLSNCAHVVLFFSCFEDQSWNVILWHTQWILDGLLWTEALTEATARSVSCLVLKQANPVHDAFSIIYHVNRKWYFHYLICGINRCFNVLQQHLLKPLYETQDPKRVACHLCIIGLQVLCSFRRNWGIVSLKPRPWKEALHPRLLLLHGQD